KLAIDRFHCVVSKLGRVQVEVLEQRQQVLLGPFEGYALLHARFHLARKPLEELTELAEFLLAGGRAVTRHVDINVPSLDLAKDLDPAADIPRPLARPDVREITVLKHGAEKRDPRGREADRGLCGRGPGFQTD